MALVQRPASTQLRLPLTASPFRPRSRVEILQSNLRRMARRSRGLEPDSTRTAWRSYLDREPLDKIVAGIRPGQTLRFR